MLHPDIAVQISHINGMGLIARGTLIWQQDAGEPTFTYEELLRLPPEQRRHCNMITDGLFTICSDGSQYMNHSCDPTAANLGDDAMIADRDLYPGDEVTYDYATSEIDPRVWPDWECHCSAPNCRRIISVYDCLRPDFQRRYAGQLASWTLAFIARHADGQ